MKLQKIVLKKNYVTMNDSEMKLINGGQVVTTRMCGDMNDTTCSGYCAPVFENGTLVSRSCQHFTILGKTSCMCS